MRTSHSVALEIWQEFWDWPAEVVKRFLCPTLTGSDSMGLGEAWEFAFLTNSQVTVPLVQEPHFENWSNSLYKQGGHGLEPAPRLLCGDWADIRETRLYTCMVGAWRRWCPTVMATNKVWQCGNRRHLGVMREWSVQYTESTEQRN